MKSILLIIILLLHYSCSESKTHDMSKKDEYMKENERQMEEFRKKNAWPSSTETSSTVKYVKKKKTKSNKR